MKTSLVLTLQAQPAQHARLAALQQRFAQACNELAPLVQRTACWNRVALHHMAYKALRERFPELGSQMVCNAIYSVSRTCRLIYQHQGSPFNLQRLAGRPLPLLQFQPDAPVYFDRHTLSLKAGQVSLFTLDGRMRFEMPLEPDAEQRFRQEKLREIVLQQQGGHFTLTFHLGEGEASVEAQPGPEQEWPEYVLVTEEPAPPLAASVPAPLMQPLAK